MLVFVFVFVFVLGFVLVFVLVDASWLQHTEISDAASKPCLLRGKGPLAQRGLKGGPPRVGPPRGYFGRNRRKWLETAQPMRQKAIQGLLSRFRWSPTTSIFDGFLADLNRALSALFFKIRLQKIENPPSPGGPP